MRVRYFTWLCENTDGDAASDWIVKSGLTLCLSTRPFLPNSCLSLCHADQGNAHRSRLTPKLIRRAWWIYNALAPRQLCAGTEHRLHHPGMQRETPNPAKLAGATSHPLPRLGLFAPGRAGGEHFAPSLRPHGYPVRDRVALQLLQRSTLFIVHRQVKMITLLISDQPSLAFQVSGNPLADRRDQRVELFGRGGIDPMKSQFSIALWRKDAINKQRMKMQVKI